MEALGRLIVVALLRTVLRPVARKLEARDRAYAEMKAAGMEVHDPLRSIIKWAWILLGLFFLFSIISLILIFVGVFEIEDAGNSRP